MAKITYIVYGPDYYTRGEEDAMVLECHSWYGDGAAKKAVRETHSEFVLIKYRNRKGELEGGVVIDQRIKGMEYER